MEVLGLILLASVFALAGFNHVKNHAGVVQYAESVGFPVPVLAGWPTGLALLAGAVGLLFESVVAAAGLAVFLAIATFYFHKDIKNDVNFGKNVALIGALLYLISAVS